MARKQSKPRIWRSKRQPLMWVRSSAVIKWSALSLVIAITIGGFSYQQQLGRDRSSAAEETAVQPSDRRNVNEGQAGQTVTGGTAITTEINTNPDVQANVERVDFFVDGQLKASLEQPPFEYDTRKLSNGKHLLAEVVYYRDGTNTTRSMGIIVNNPQSLASPMFVIPAALVGIALLLFIIPFTRHAIARRIALLPFLKQYPF
jgi:hypothetical protein